MDLNSLLCHIIALELVVLAPGSAYTGGSGGGSGAALFSASTIMSSTTTMSSTEYSAMTGPIGATGLPGDPGPKGEIGNTGMTGPTGWTGPAGPQGMKGEKGEFGYTGQTGYTGKTGPAGPKGEMGNQGGTGATGIDGRPGATGIQGASGLQGYTGYTGPTGPKGERGIRGFDGPTGATGIGAPGASGAKGQKGEAGGPPGPPGPPGPAGINGSPSPTNLMIVGDGSQLTAPNGTVIVEPLNSTQKTLLSLSPIIDVAYLVIILFLTIWVYHNKKLIRKLRRENVERNRKFDKFHEDMAAVKSRLAKLMGRDNIYEDLGFTADYCTADKYQMMMVQAKQSKSNPVYGVDLNAATDDGSEDEGVSSLKNDFSEPIRSGANTQNNEYVEPGPSHTADRKNEAKPGSSRVNDYLEPTSRANDYLEPISRPNDYLEPISKPNDYLEPRETETLGLRAELTRHSPYLEIEKSPTPPPR